MANYYPDAISDPGNDAGEYTDTGEPKGLLHTTEGKSYSGSKAAYIANNSWPHFTATYETGSFKIYQHNPLNKPSRSLRNEAGGVQTNRDNVIQIELVGTADRTKADSWGSFYVGNWPRGYYDGIKKWMRWVEANHHVPKKCTVTFKTYPESYGSNGVRLTGSQWDAYSGWLGHMHAPENTHGDPGLIDIDYLLEDDDDMYGWTEDEFKTVIRNIIKQEVPKIVQAEVDERFATGGSLTRVNIAGSTAVTSLIELALQRSASFNSLQEQVKHIHDTVMGGN